MTRRRYKIHPMPLPGGLPVPTLDPVKAPWSSPRGFATTISEEAEALRQAARQSKPSKPLPIMKHTKKQTPKLKTSCPNIFKKAFWAIYNHFQAITFSEERHDEINDRMHRFIGFVCCIRADVIASLQPQEKNTDSQQ